MTHPPPSSSPAPAGPASPPPLQIVHLSTYARDGGAGKSAKRVHDGLRTLGVASRMITLRDTIPSDAVEAFRPDPARPLRRRRTQLHARLTREAPLLQTNPTAEYFTSARSTCLDLPAQIGTPDIIHLHWVANFVDWPTFFPALPPGQKVVLTLRDMNPLTGGCHCDFDCGRFRQACGQCPQLVHAGPADASAQNHRRKTRGLAALASDQLVVVSLSHYLSNLARASTLLGRFTHHVIPNGVETHCFRPLPRASCRDVLGLPPNAKIVAFIADAIHRPTKGLPDLLAALASLADIPDLFLLAVGGHLAPGQLPAAGRSLSPILDHRLLAAAYAAADVFVMPSLQEAFGQACLEAMACGIPVVASATGGALDMVRPGETGLLVPPHDPPALACALRTLLLDPARRETYAARAREIVLQDYTVARETRRYLELYHSLLNTIPTSR